MGIWDKFTTKVLICLEKCIIYDLILYMKIIDAHSHIDYITHNFQTDVMGTVVCTTNESQWNVLLDMINHDNKIYGAFGIHPWFIEDVKDGFENRLEDLLKTNKAFMVGEIGLDKFKPNMETQIEIFKSQLDIAVKLKRTVWLHCVGAWDKVFHIFKQYNKKDLPLIVVHDFNGSNDILQKLQDNYNVVFSIGKNLMYHENSRIEQIDINKILIETDGKKDVLLKDIMEKISVIKNDKNISNVIYNNTLKVLDNGKIE